MLSLKRCVARVLVGTELIDESVNTALINSSFSLTQNKLMASAPRQLGRGPWQSLASHIGTILVYPPPSPSTCLAANLSSEAHPKVGREHAELAS